MNWLNSTHFSNAVPLWPRHRNRNQRVLGYKSSALVVRLPPIVRVLVFFMLHLLSLCELVIIIMHYELCSDCIPPHLNAPQRRGLQAVREGRVVVVDGNMMFNRPSPRLLDALEWLVALLHDRLDLAPPGFPWTVWTQPPHDAKALPRALAKDGASHDGSQPCSQVRISGESPDLGSRRSSSAEMQVSCCPGLPSDIEECHRRACMSGKDNYMDPVTGYMVREISLYLLTRFTLAASPHRPAHISRPYLHH